VLLTTTRRGNGFLFMLNPVARFLVERKLAQLTDRLRALRDELAVIDEQLAQLSDEAEDHRLRALVSETPIADRDFREAHRHVDAMARRRAEVVEQIARFEQRQDELLDQLGPA
jgi:CII-binding regulator of phage lambda lysogenization HflD